MDINIRHDEQDQTFYALVEGDEAELAYSLPEKGIIDFQHTYVPDELRGKGVGEELVKAGFTYAKENNLKVIATCRFVSSYVKRHAAEYDSLLAK